MDAILQMILDSIEPGSKVRISLGSGEVFEGILKAKSEEFVLLETPELSAVKINQICAIKNVNDAAEQPAPQPSPASASSPGMVQPPPSGMQIPYMNPMPWGMQNTPMMNPMMQGMMYPGAPTSTASQQPHNVLPDSPEPFICNESSITRFFESNLNKEAKKLINSAYSSFKNSLHNHDTDRMRDAANRTYDLIESSDELHDDENLLELCGYMFYLCGEFEISQNCFCYCSNFHEGYRSSYAAGEYDAAAAFAALFIQNCNAVDINRLPDAFRTLASSCVNAKDIAALEYLCKYFGGKYPVNGSDYILETVKAINIDGECRLYDFSNISVCIQMLRGQYKETKAEELIKVFSDMSSKTANFHDDENSAEPDKTEEDPVISGQIIKNRWLSGKGVILCGDKEYPFNFDRITDTKLKNVLGKSPKMPINIEFELKNGIPSEIRFKKVKRNDHSTDGVTPEAVLAKANFLFTQKQLEKAQELYEQLLDTKFITAGFCGYIQTSLALANQLGEESRAQEALDVAEEYKDRITDSAKTSKALSQLYSRFDMMEQAMEQFKIMLDNAETNNAKLDCLKNIIRCCAKLQRYEEVIDRCKEWIRIWDKDRTFMQNDSMLRNEIYPPLAEAYYYSGDAENARKYAKKSSENLKSMAILERLSDDLNLGKEEADDFSTEEPAPTEEDVTTTEQETEEVLTDCELSDESLEECFACYKDTAGLEQLGISSEEITAKAFSFGAGYEYATLAYLHAAARITPELIPVYRMASYAYDNPSESYNYSSDALGSAFGNWLGTDRIYDELYAASVMRAAFYNHSQHDYGISGLTSTIGYGGTLPGNSSNEIVELVNLMTEFREKTGHGMELFTHSARNDEISDPSAISGQAVEYAAQIHSQCVRESVDRIRYTRMMMFDENSELRVCFNAVCDNDTTRADEISETISVLFLKPNRKLSVENIDRSKMDEYINNYWEKAGIRMKNEGKLVDRSSDLVSSRRSNVCMMAERMLDFICKWVNSVRDASENTILPEQQAIYEDYRARCCELLESLVIDNADVGYRTNSVTYTAREILERLSGKYDENTGKYFYAGFLYGDEILLDDSYQPELQSTFCDLPGFDIFSRIEHHVSADRQTLEERINEILSDNIKKNNFRSLRLIREYAKECSIPGVDENNSMFRYIDKCISQTMSRIKLVRKRFIGDLALAQNYSRISNRDGKVTNIENTAEVWFRITARTSDFGFYATLIEYYNNKISEDAMAYGESLRASLDSIIPPQSPCDNSNGEGDTPLRSAYTREEIERFIDDRNYTVAEDLISRITRGDTEDAKDYTIEPLSYLRDFFMEYDKVYDIVKDKSITLEKSIMRFQRSGVPMKNIKGGKALLENWIKNGDPDAENRIKAFLGKLGWANCTVKPENTPNSTYESYLVEKPRIRGRENYQHPIPAFSSVADSEPFRIICLYGHFDSDWLISIFNKVNTVSLNTIVLIDYSLPEQERRRLARKSKEAALSKAFIVIDRVLLFYLAEHYSEPTINKMLMAVAFPFTYYQPFVSDSAINVPPELFTGRVHELKEIEASDGANIIFGGRQLGKSALLKMARKNIDHNQLGHRAVVVDIQGRNDSEAAKKISEELIIAGIFSADLITDDWDKLIFNIKLRLSDENAEPIGYLLLMLDEADAFIESCKDKGYRPIVELKGLLSPKFKFVMAGLHNLIRFDHEAATANNSILIHLKSMVIKPFRAPEAAELLTRTLGYLGFRIPEQTVKMIVATANYFPGLIQLYCKRLIEAMTKPGYAGYNELDTPPYEVTDSHIKSVLSDPSFMKEIHDKLELTMLIDKDQGGYYLKISLLIAELRIKCPDAPDYSIEEIRRTAREYEISSVCEMDGERLEELMDELCSLNVLRCHENRYTFSGSRYCDILGSDREIEEKLILQSEGGDNSGT